MAGGVVGGVEFFDAGDEDLDGFAGELYLRHADGGEGRVDELGEVDVVEADDGHVFGDAEAACLEGAEGADGHEVVGAEDGGGRLGVVEQFGHAGHAAFELVVAFDDELFFGDAAGGGHGLVEGDAAEGGGVLVEGSADEADLGVAEGDEVADGLFHAVAVVDHDGVLGEGLLGDVDEDHGDVAGGEVAEDGVFDAEGHDGDAVDVALDEATEAVLDLGVVVGGADEELVVALDGGLFEALDELGEEGVGDVGDEEADESAASGDEGAGLGVGEVVELADGVADACSHGRVDGRDVVDCAGDGGDGDAGEPGNIAYIKAHAVVGVCCCFYSPGHRFIMIVS